MSLLHEIEALLDERSTVLGRACEHIERRLRQLTDDVSQIRSLRPRLVEARVKDASELEKKAVAHGWSASQALDEAGDVVGARIVCNNTSDVYRLKDCIRACEDLTVDDDRIEDYIEDPKETGYRALHLPVALSVPSGNEMVNVLCEVQIRTVAQDAWAIWTHGDWYKNADGPEEVRTHFPILAQQLDAVQQTADLLRQAIDLKREPREIGRAAPGGISPEAIQDVYASVFSDGMSWGELTEVVSLAEEHGIETVSQVLDVLNNDPERRRLDSAIASAGGPTNLSLVLAAGLVAKYGFHEGFLKYVIDYAGLEDFEEALRARVGYCPTCQPYEDGEVMWLLGEKVGCYDEVLRDTWSDLYDQDLPDNINELIGALGWLCPNCGAELDGPTEIGAPD